MPQERRPAPLEVLPRLHRQVKALVVVLTVADSVAEVGVLLRELADTAETAASLLSGIDPAVLVELHSAFVHARAGHLDELRSDLLIASGRLAVLLHTDRPRRAAAAHEPTLRWSLD
jgi:predicted transcriptional regulator